MQTDRCASVRPGRKSSWQHVCLEFQTRRAVPNCAGRDGRRYAAADGYGNRDDQCRTGPTNPGGQIYSAPAVSDDGTIYVTAFSNSFPLFALNADGTVKWQKSNVTWLPAVTLDRDGAVFVGTFNGPTDSGMTAFNADGSVRW